MLLFILVAVFLGTVLVIIATYTFANRRRLAAAEALRDRLAPMTATSQVRILKEDRASQLKLLNRLLDGKAITATLSRELERAGSQMTVGAFVLLTALGGVVGYLIGQRFGGFLVVLPAIAGALLPIADLRRRQRARVKAYEAQLPEAIDMLVNAMRAGYSLQAAMKFIGEEMSAPLGPEFARFYDEQRLGMEVRRALLNLQDRTDTLDLKMFVTALLIQRETGGNLTEVMTNLATLMRERVGIRGQIETLTAEPRLSAIILSLLPVGMFGFMFLTNRSYVSPLFTTTVGRIMFIYGIFSVIVGYVLLRRLGNVDI